MINFPLLSQLDITSYGLFPGVGSAEPGLHVHFPPGLTLVLGTNGLGKTTLITILFRMLTGPYDIPGISGSADLGNINLEVKMMGRKARAIFAQRVVDDARNASATLVFQLGNHRVAIERRLSDLALRKFELDGRGVSAEEKDSFQAQIIRLAGVSSFGDWVLLLRHLVFYFEDRRELVWDASAQRQILRLLLLPADIAKKWTDDERAVLALDSQTRNMLVFINRGETALEVGEGKLEAGMEVREELRTLTDIQEVALMQREELSLEIEEAEVNRQRARLRLLNVEQERETRYREFERAKLLAIEARFPDRSETARFILAQLLTDGQCLACGTDAPAAANSYATRIRDKQCVICGSDLSGPSSSNVPELSTRRIERTAHSLTAVERDLREAKIQLNAAEELYKNFEMKLTQLSVLIADRAARVEILVRRLPPEEGVLREQRSEISVMRSQYEKLRHELVSRRAEFRDFVADLSITLAKYSERVKVAFDESAKGFLLEECRLIWSPQKQRLGETGSQIEFPAFQLEMGGTNFATTVRRTGPEEVSESQREFIDLAFRMALIAVAGSGGSGSLVIDAPESSLDAVFVSRAAAVLAKFATASEGNRLVVTSNLVESKLIPNLIKESSSGAGREWALVDLLVAAVPTAAVRELRKEYIKVRDKLLRSGRGS